MDQSTSAWNASEQASSGSFSSEPNLADSHFSKHAIHPPPKVPWVLNAHMKQLKTCCTFDHLLSQLNAYETLCVIKPTTPLPIQINTFEKTAVASTSYIVYVIQTQLENGGDISFLTTCKRRYSEFEALRTLLERLHPTCVIPPIPQKQTVREYAAKMGKVVDDATVIEKRMRLLKVFLNRLVSHDVLSREHLVHEFIQGPASWNEILVASGYEQLIKQKDKTRGYLEKRSIKQQDEHLRHAIQFTASYTSHLKHIIKLHHDLNSHFNDMTHLLSEIGTCYNSFSLSSPPCSTLERIGEAFDATHSVHTTQLLPFQHFCDTYFFESQGYAKILEKLLSRMQEKQTRYDTLVDNCESKKQRLKKTEESELEALRIGQVLEGEGVVPHPVGLIAKLNALMDRDPVLARRNFITQTRQDISVCEIEIAKCKEELTLFKEEVFVQLGNFQRVKEKDAHVFWKEYAHYMKEFYSSVRDCWSNCLYSESELLN